MLVTQNRLFRTKQISSVAVEQGQKGRIFFFAVPLDHATLRTYHRLQPLFKKGHIQRTLTKNCHTCNHYGNLESHLNHQDTSSTLYHNRRYCNGFSNLYLKLLPESHRGVLLTWEHTLCIGFQEWKKNSLDHHFHHYTHTFFSFNQLFIAQSSLIKTTKDITYRKHQSELGVLSEIQ